jgi:hypothetical protein
MSLASEGFVDEMLNVKYKRLRAFSLDREAIGLV